MSHTAADPQRIRALLDFAMRKYRVTVLDVSGADVAALDSLGSLLDCRRNQPGTPVVAECGSTDTGAADSVRRVRRSRA